jgi:hypothetical protein
LAEILKLCAQSTRGLPDPARIPPDRPPREVPEPQAPSPAPPPAVQLPPETMPRMTTILPDRMSYDLVARRRH